MIRMRNPNAIAGVYCFAVLIACNLAGLGIFGVPIQWVLSHQMGLTAHEVSQFGLLADIPNWAGFTLGFLRDRWRPGTIGDRAYFLIGGLLMACIYEGLAFSPDSYGVLLVYCIGQAILAALLGAASAGLVASLAKQHGMTGRIGAMTVIASSFVAILSSSVGGFVDQHFGHTWAFQVSAFLCLPMLAAGFWQPKAVFKVEQDFKEEVNHEDLRSSLATLAKHKTIYLPAVASFLWAFAPGWGTPLLFFFTKDRHLPEAVYGNALGLIAVGRLLSCLSYGWLCRKFPFRALAYAATIGGILGAALFLFTTNAVTAYLFSFLAGASCGVPMGAYADLVIRSCPRKFAGTVMTLFASAGCLAADVSDLFGSWLYEKGGFYLALLATSGTTVLILVVLALVPRAITNPPEGTPILADLDKSASDKSPFMFNASPG